MSAFFKAMMAGSRAGAGQAHRRTLGHRPLRLSSRPVSGAKWLEINDRYRDTVRAFLARGCGKMGDFATRLVGSRDLFPEELALPPHQRQLPLLSRRLHPRGSWSPYNQRHNQANGEDNRDGHGNNLSSNHGVEGPTLDPRINNLRQQQKRNLIATLLLSQGTPHFLAGDEMGRSQLGNNNAYCQDNQISWVNWHLRRRTSGCSPSPAR